MIQFLYSHPFLIGLISFVIGLISMPLVVEIARKSTLLFAPTSALATLARYRISEV